MIRTLAVTKFPCRFADTIERMYQFTACYTLHILSSRYYRSILRSSQPLASTASSGFACPTRDTLSLPSSS